ncbi:MAG: hypothetical protein KGV43_03135 [Arcobacter sp.]|nr:hypothetical protein [Arcobacter sp.]
MTRNNLIMATAPSLLGATTLGAFALKKGELDKKDTFRTVVKRTTQGTIASLALMKANSYYTKENSLFKALATIGAAAAGIYALEVLDKKACEKELCEKEEEQKDEL